MKHDPRLVRAEAHEDWCECLLCGPRPNTLQQDIRETLVDSGFGLALAVIVSAAVLVINHWPAIAAAAENFHG